jgi:hypothetical protein
MNFSRPARRAGLPLSGKPESSADIRFEDANVGVGPLEQPEHDRANNGKRDIRGDYAQPILGSHGLLRFASHLPAPVVPILAIAGLRKKTAVLTLRILT